MEAIELLKNKFGVSQKYMYELKEGDVTVLEIYWNPLTIAEREMIVAKSGDSGTNDDFALNLMITKALDKEGKRLFSEADRASLRREIPLSVLTDIMFKIQGAAEEVDTVNSKSTSE